MTNYPDHFLVMSTYFGQKRELEFIRDGNSWRIYNHMGDADTYIPTWTMEQLSNAFKTELDEKTLIAFKDTTEHIVPII